MNQKPYGADFTFSEQGSFSSKSTARLASLALMSAFLVIATPLRRSVRPLLPKPGEGPSNEARDKGWLKGLFVVETISVIIQIGIYKLTGKRVFLMAPLHHHFEKLGWKESTIVIRFWIIGLLLALFSLATFKFR